jgi:hypothetical protein
VISVTDRIVFLDRTNVFVIPSACPGHNSRAD